MKLKSRWSWKLAYLHFRDESGLQCRTVKAKFILKGILLLLTPFLQFTITWKQLEMWIFFFCILWSNPRRLFSLGRLRQIHHIHTMWAYVLWYLIINKFGVSYFRYKRVKHIHSLHFVTKRVDSYIYKTNIINFIYTIAKNFLWILWIEEL